MDLHDLFHQVKSAGPYERQEFWGLCKQAAESDPDGVELGLAKIALEIWHRSDATVDRAHRAARAGSFASALQAEKLAERLEAEGHINNRQRAKLSALIAESAFEDLTEITKKANLLDRLRNLSPQGKGALAGAAVGAGLGAYSDEDNRLRGAALYTLPGATIGALLGHGAHELELGRRGPGGGGLEPDLDVLNLGKKDHRAKLEQIANETAGELGSKLDSILHSGSPSSAMKSPADNAFTGPASLAAGSGGGYAHLPLPSAQPIVEHVRSKKGSLLQKLSNFFPGEAPAQPPEPGGIPMSPALAGGEQAPEPGPESLDQDAQQQPNAAADALLSGVDKGNKTLDNMIFLANQVQKPELAQELEAMREELIDHFGGGNAYLPPALQHHFSKSEHAEEFMKKYKQRFGAITGGQKKAAAVYRLR